MQKTLTLTRPLHTSVGSDHTTVINNLVLYQQLFHWFRAGVVDIPNPLVFYFWSLVDNVISRVVRVLSQELLLAVKNRSNELEWFIQLHVTDCSMWSQFLWNTTSGQKNEAGRQMMPWLLGIAFDVIFGWRHKNDQLYILWISLLHFNCFISGLFVKSIKVRKRFGGSHELSHATKKLTWKSSKKALEWRLSRS